MEKKRPKNRVAFAAVRIAICVAALWIVARGVTLSDRVQLQTGEQLSGSILSDGDEIHLRLASGEIRRIPRGEITLSKDGTLALSYGLKTTLMSSNKRLLLLALCLYFPVVLPQAFRLFWLLRAQHIRVGYWECVKVSLAGNFLNFATPFGSNAGDLFKAYFVSLHTTQKTEAITTVILDRFVGLATLLIIAGAITIFSAPGSRLAVVRPYILSMLCIGVAVLFVYRLPIARKLLHLESISKWPLLDQIKRIDQTVHKLTGHFWAIAAAIAMTAFLQALALTAFFVIAKALGMLANRFNILEYFAYFYTGTIISALPGPPQGLGTVELAYRYFFEPFGTPSQIICMAFAIRITGLIAALPGLLITMTGAYKPTQAESQIAPESAIAPAPVTSGINAP